MKPRRNLYGVIFYALFIGLVIALVPRSNHVGTAAFKGWTNTTGELHAIIEFPPAATKEPSRNYFLTWFYCVHLDLNYLLPESGPTNQTLWLPVRGSPRTPTLVQIPVPQNATDLKFTRAETTIERRWDNVQFPIRPSSTRFHFTPPTIAPPK